MSQNPPNNNTDVAKIVRCYGEAKGAADHQIAWGLNAAGNALREGITPTGAALAGMSELDLAVEMIGETSK